MPYVVDTNIISEVTKHRLNDNVLAWFWDYNQDVFLTTVSVMELHYGIMRLPDGKRKAALKTQINAIIKDCSDHIYPLDSFSAYLCADLRCRAHYAGRTPQIADLMIAAICKANNATLVTHNVKDFDYLGIDIVDPFDYEPLIRAELLHREAER